MHVNGLFKHSVCSNSLCSSVPVISVNSTDGMAHSLYLKVLNTLHILITSTHNKCRLRETWILVYFLLDGKYTTI